MKKKIITFAAATVMTLAMSMTAFAGQWVSDANGWWWQNDDGSYPANTWQWIDGNQDGVAESYYFNAQGYCLQNTTTPDGYTVNADGAWIADGAVQTQQVSTQAANTQNAETQATAQVNSEAPNVAGIYKGAYNGSTITCEIVKESDTVYWVEIDYFIKDMLPSYAGNGVFADAYNRYTFSGNTLIFEDLYSGETVQFTKQ